MKCVVIERKVFNYTNYINKKFDDVNKVIIAEEEKTKFKNMIRLESSSFLTLLVFIYFLISLSHSVAKGVISIGLLIATVKQLQIFLEIIRWELYSVLEIKSEVQNYLNDLNEFYNYSEVVSIRNDKEHNIKDSKIKNIIAIKNLNFTYPKTEKVILKNFNFNFEKK